MTMTITSPNNERYYEHNLERKYCDFVWCSNKFPLSKSLRIKYCSKQCGWAASYMNNHELVKKNNNEWRKNNPDLVKEYRRRGYRNNPEQVKERSDRWRKNNPDIISTVNIPWMSTCRK